MSDILTINAGKKTCDISRTIAGRLTHVRNDKMFSLVGSLAIQTFSAASLTLVTKHDRVTMSDDSRI